MQVRMMTMLKYVLLQFYYILVVLFHTLGAVSIDFVTFGKVTKMAPANGTKKGHSVPSLTKNDRT